jgi:hypothetical protein
MAGGDIENGGASDAVQRETTLADENSASSSLEPSSQPAPDPVHQVTPVAFQQAPRQHVKLMLDGFSLDEAALVNSSLLSYLAMVASVIEGRTISRKELLHVLRKSMRQRSFDRLPRREYVLRFHDQHPP